MIETKIWWIASYLISVTGFAVVGGVSLYNGEALYITAIRAVAVFIALWLVLRFLRALLGLTIVSESHEENAKESMPQG